jgi:hypothetical protein
MMTAGEVILALAAVYFSFLIPGRAGLWAFVVSMGMLGAVMARILLGLLA